MGQSLQELLPGAIGQSTHVVAVFVDVRGFSTYAGHAESVETAIFLRKLYLAILNDFINEFDFAKPTGDGLMIIRCFSEEEISDVCIDTIEKCKQLVEMYPSIFEDDPMLSRRLPEHIGIGVALGAATRLSAREETIDFSGRPLNLAARLMDLARPEGVVFDRRVRLAIGKAEVAATVECDDNVHIKGVAEDEAIEVYFWPEWTVLPDSVHFPMGEYEWVKGTEVSLTLAEMRETGSFLFPLNIEPAFPDEIKIKFRYPALRSNGTKLPNQTSSRTRSASLLENADGKFARIDLAEVAEGLSTRGVKSSWAVTAVPEYRVPKGAGRQGIETVTTA
jgi:class 3 adenylate cyclase